MRHFFNSFSKIDYLVIGLLSVLYLFLLLQACPISHDDFIYRFSQRSIEGYEQWTYPISSFKELILSNIEGYLYGNGRFLVHCFVQYCLNHYTCFYVGSTLMFALLLMSLTYLVRLYNTFKKGDILYNVFALFCFVPLMATLFYGTVAMTINYMWSAAIYTFFISVYLHTKEHNVEHVAWKNILLLIFGLICGSWQESFCIGIAGILCIYHLIKIKNTRGSLLYLLIGFGIGAAILVFAPGNFIRVSAGNDAFNIQGFIYQLKQIVKYNLFSILWIIIGILSIVIDLCKTRKIIFVLTNWLFFGSGIIAFSFTLFTIVKGCYQGKWQMTMLSIWSVVLLVSFVKFYFDKTLEKIGKLFLPMMCLLLLGGYWYIYYYRSIVQKEITQFTTEFVLNRPDTIYDGHLHYTVSRIIPNHEFLFEKICPMYIIWLDLNIYNRMARFYSEGEEIWGTVVLPEPIDSIVARCTKDKVVYVTPLNYAVVPIINQSPTEDLYLKIYTNSKYPMDKLKDKLYGRKTRELEIPLSGLRSIKHGDYIYFVSYIDWWRFHNREITNIVLEER